MSSEIGAKTLTFISEYNELWFVYIKGSKQAWENKTRLKSKNAKATKAEQLEVFKDFIAIFYFLTSHYAPTKKILSQVELTAVFYPITSCATGKTTEP